MVEFRTIQPDEFGAFLRADANAFGFTPDDKAEQAARLFLEPDRCVAAVIDGRIVGGAATVSLTLTAPGDRMPAAGVTWVAVSPTHRRQGILRGLMRCQLRSYRDGGEPVAALGASESGIYRRFGYGRASRASAIDIERAHARMRDPSPAPGSVDLVDADTVVREVAPVYDRVAARTNGMFSRSNNHWRALHVRATEKRGEQSASFMLVHRNPAGSIDGHASYRMALDWGGAAEVASGTVTVSDFIAEGSDAYRGLWQYLLSLDLTSRVVAERRPIDEPLDHLLADPRRLRRTLRDDFHLRIIDVARALSSRRYAREDALVLEVYDQFCPEFGGRYRLEGGLGGAACTPTDAAADLVVDTVALGAAYLGDVSVALLARSGLAEERTAGSVLRAAAMLQWPEPPFSPVMF